MAQRTSPLAPQLAMPPLLAALQTLLAAHAALERGHSPRPALCAPGGALAAHLGRLQPCPAAALAARLPGQGRAGPHAAPQGVGSRAGRARLAAGRTRCRWPRRAVAAG